MTAGGMGMPRMMHALEPREVGKVWLGGSPGSVCGGQSCCLSIGVPWAPFPHSFSVPQLQTPLHSLDSIFFLCFMTFYTIHILPVGLQTLHIFHVPGMPSLFLSFCLFRTEPMAYVAYGSSQVRALILDVAASLHHSHSNARSLTY